MSRALLGLCLALLAGVPASAQNDVAAFYKGKTIRLVVGIGGSLYLSATLTQSSAPLAYFSAQTRAWEFGIGALVMGAMGGALQRREKVSVTGRYRNAAGAYRVLETVAHPRFGLDGSFLGLTGVNTDITEQRQVREEDCLTVGSHAQG